MPGNIHVLMFDDINGAENMLDNVTSWEKAGWLKIEDAVVVKTVMHHFEQEG